MRVGGSVQEPVTEQRRVVQIAFACSGENESASAMWTLAALCDDGSMWRMLWAEPAEVGWTELPRVPGT
jgi:hypothetical protein